MALEALLAPAVGAGVNVGVDAAISLLDKWDYWNDLKRHYKELMEEARKLWALRDGIKAEISKNRRSREMTRWIAEVEVIQSDVRELEDKYQNRKNHSWGLRRIELRIDLSKNMAMECKQVRGLWEAGIRMRGEFDAELPVAIITIPAPSIEHNSSQHKAVEDLVNYLKEEEVARVGIWGTVGIGKTVIMQNLNNHQDTAQMFGMVIWVTVSKDWSIESLQHQIMRRLQLNTGSTENENAEIISEELKEKKCLILLDDVCHHIELVKIIGVHDNQKCKVVLSSRDRDLCKEMEVDEIITVKPLSNTDAFNMFKGIVGEYIYFPRIKPMAERVLRECGGLPLLIGMLAKAFRRMRGDFQLWKRGLESLRNWMNMEGMDEVLEVLKFCYRCLDNDVKKNCFLYSALYPEEREIYVQHLLECWRVEGFTGDNGHWVLKHLIDSSLLEGNGNKKSVTMNKVLREMALKLLSQTEDFNFLVKPREGLHEPPNPEEWGQVSRISLMDNELSSLPETPNCHHLLTLLLQRNKNLITVPQFFFTSMCNLRVLDLHGTGIESLPSSLSRLICLKGLYLNSCFNLIELPTDIDALKQLEVLDIRGTRLSLFQIRSLTWLKLLRISLSNFGFEIGVQNQSGNLSRFVSLEEFSVYMDSSKHWWEVIKKIIVKEVAALEKLTSLQFCFPSVDCLELFVRTSLSWKDFFLRNESASEDFPFTFRFAVGCHSLTGFHILESFDEPGYNCLKFINGEGMNPVFLNVLAKTEAFGLINHKGVSRLSDFYMESMKNLIICSVEGCNEIETIVDGTRMTKGVLEYLQHLQVANALKLESIWQGPVHAGSLTQLRTLTLVKCPQLKKIFCNALIQQLSKLEDLSVENCGQIEEMITKSEKDVSESNQLPRLKTLTLLNLPKLRLICDDDSLQWRSLRRIEISMCGMLKSLPFNYANSTKLRQIKGQRAWWEALEWTDDGAMKQRLESLCILN